MPCSPVHEAFCKQAIIRLVLLIFGVVSVGCGSAQKVGVRSTFKNATVFKVAIIDVYATGTFSQDEDAFKRIVETYNSATEESARALGFEVVTRESFDASFGTDESRQDFRDAMPVRQSLDSLFEPGYGDSGREVDVVMASADKLPAKALLIAEIVYFSVGYCEADPTRHNRYAQLSDPKEGECVVSHFQAKLVDAATGSTMWHNRGFLEHRSSEAAEKQTQVIYENVRNVLQDKDGLGSFRGPSS